MLGLSSGAHQAGANAILCAECWQCLVNTDPQ